MNKFERAPIEGEEEEKRDKLQEEAIVKAARLLAEEDLYGEGKGFKEERNAAFHGHAVLKKAHSYEKGLSYIYESVEDMLLSSEDPGQALADYYRGLQKKMAKEKKEKEDKEKKEKEDREKDKAV